MTDIGKDVFLSVSRNGTRKQNRTAKDGPPGGGRSGEMRKLGLTRRRAKDLDDIPGEPNKTERRKKAKKKKGP